MKDLSDGTQVPARCYYYLLDYMDVEGKEEFEKRYGTRRLYDLNNAQFWAFFRTTAAKDDLKNNPVVG